MAFNYNLKENILKTLEKINFNNPTKVQENVIPHILKNKNVVCASPTGSGKTHAFLIPIINNIKIKFVSTQAIIISPTKELAQQIYNVAKMFNENYPELKIGLVSSNSEMTNATDKHLLVCTPNKLESLISESIINLTHINYIVLDECDMLLDLGFQDLIIKMMAFFKEKNTSISAFSATINDSLRNFLKKFLNDAKVVEVDKKIANQNIKHFLLNTSDSDVAFKKVIGDINPYLAIVFVNNRNDINKIMNILLENNKNAVALHGELKSSERQKILKRLNNNDFNFLVATDLASRGIDLEAVSHVISLGFPNNMEYYIHRSGRTGRYKSEGISICITSDSNNKELFYLKKWGIEFEKYKSNLSQPIRKKKHRKPHNEELQLKIQKIRNKYNLKKFKNKPNSKKKMNEEIDNLKKDIRRQHIKESIKKIRKAKAIERQKLIEGE